MEIFYHGTQEKNLVKIEPRLSTHGKKYVYAAKDRLIALLFMARWNDFLLTLRIEKQGGELKITLIERYHNAIEELFANKSGAVYTIQSDTFFQTENTWEHEWVSLHTAYPVQTEII
jgi:hypothetical protein